MLRASPRWNLSRTCFHSVFWWQIGTSVLAASATITAEYEKGLNFLKITLGYWDWSKATFTDGDFVMLHGKSSEDWGFCSVTLKLATIIVGGNEGLIPTEKEIHTTNTLFISVHIIYVGFI